MVGKIGIVRSLNLSNIILVYDIYFVNIYIKRGGFIMKCQKCGAEIPAGSKFCNECGAKIEQVALFKDDESKNTEPCKCESCGNIIPNNSVFCPICHTYQKNKFNPTGDVEKKADKKPIYRTPHFYIALLIALILGATVVTAISQCSNQPDFQEPVTTSPTQAPTDTLDTDMFRLYNITPFSIAIPRSWSHTANDDNDCFLDSDNNILFIATSQLDDSQSQINSNVVDVFIDGFKDSLDEFDEIDRTTTHIDDFFAYRVEANVKKSENKYHYTMYVWATDHYLCEMIFSSYGNEQSEEFDLFETDIVNSITVDSSKDVRSPKKDSTKKATEPETEKTTKKPTEPPTEKPVDKITVSQSNALESAKSYLEYSAFSYNGLVEQLEYEKYSHEDAVYAADHCGADWNEQAAKSAESYLAYSSFSRDGLIEQLEYEGFTHEQAVYGVEQNGL
jgi:hypothetical protein|nr:MAG TPA: Host cell surface-exposed lipoprotein [Caudoviricetes sp.]